MLFCRTFHLSTPRCFTASTYPMPHLYRREELELAFAETYFHRQIPAAQRYTASQWEGWKQSLTSCLLVKSPELWLLDKTSSLQAPSAMPMLTSFYSFNSGSTQGLLASLLLRSQILNREVEAEFCHSFFFFPSACFYLLCKQLEENKMWLPTGISSGRDKHLMPSRAGLHVIPVITLT